MSNEHYFYFKWLIFLALSKYITEGETKTFKKGKALTSEEFSLAEKINASSEHFPVDLSVLEDDIIQSFLTRNYYIEDFLWPGGIVPYILDDQYDKKWRILIANAFQEFQNKTCIKFEPRTDQEDYIQITYAKGCSSHVGRIGGAQTVILGGSCYSLGIIMHELMHSLGFIHEQCRTDRDKYVTVMWENIRSGGENNFKIWHWYSERILKVKYDYSSILHYNRFAFSKDVKSKPTLIPKNSKEEIGQRRMLSKRDVLKINTAYRCPIIK